MLNIYRASAGSGKTYSLTEDYIQLLFASSKERAHRRIMAVTFTNKATEEMKSRILKELHALSTGQKSDYRKGLVERFKKSEAEINTRAKQILIAILHDYSAFSVSTIDRFFQQVIRSFARDIGVHGGYNLELDASKTLEQAIDNMFLDLSKDENKQLLSWLTEFAEERVENSEGWNLRRSIVGLGNEIFKESYQHKAEAANRKLHDRAFLTNYRKKLRQIKTDFEKKVVDEACIALQIIADNGLTTESFKGGSRSAMKGLEKLRNKNFDVSNFFFALAEDVSNAYTKSAKSDIIEAIETAYAQGLQHYLARLSDYLTTDIINYNSAQIVLKHINTLGILSDLALQIKTLTDEQNTLLISDTNMLLNKIIDNSDTPFVYEKTGLNIDHFMIDEFQDTSTLQWKNFHPLLKNSLSEGYQNLVVGDVKQSIYRWRNSDWKLLDETIKHDFDAEQIRERNLDTNWRSDRNIVAFNNTFFRQAAALLQSKLNEKIAPLLPVYPQLEHLQQRIEHAYENIHQKTSPKAGEGHVRFEFLSSDNDNGETWKEKSLNRLPSLLEDLQDRGYRPQDVCLLVRKNSEEQAVVRKLLNYKTTTDAKAGYCYDIMGNEGLLIASVASVRFVLSLLRLFVNPNDGIQQTIVRYEHARICQGKSPDEALNGCFEAEDDFCLLFSDEENRQLEQIRHLSLFDMVERIIALFGLGSWHNEAVFIQAFQNAVFQYSIGKTVDLNSFLTWWDENETAQYISMPDNQRAFRIMTIHKSKGLDFGVVVMPFADWKLDSRMQNILWCEPSEVPFNELPLLPIEYSGKLEKTIFSELYLDEQMHQYIDCLNLAYVAFTRAKHELICFAPKIKDEKSGIVEKVDSLSAMLDFCLRKQMLNLEQDELTLSTHYDDETNSFELGEASKQTVPEPLETTVDTKIDNYPSVSSAERLHIRQQGRDYWLQSQELTDSRLNYGLIMHDILRQINRRSDQENAILSLVRSGRINDEDAVFIRQELEAFWQLPETEDWFSPDVRVLNETSIITPSGSHYRPDRVIFRQNHATVIDYKFGDNENPAYVAQVRNYMDLIAQMNYEVKGFVCYVTLRKCVNVEM